MLSIQRRWYSLDVFDDVYPRIQTPEKSNMDKCKGSCDCSRKRLWKILAMHIPIVKFIKEYKKENVLGDFISGLTATFLHLPQGLGYGALSGLQPVNGLYTTFFSVLIYLIFGTSPNISMGPSAVMALLTQNIVQREVDLLTSAFFNNNLTLTKNNESHNILVNSSNTKIIFEMKNELLQIKVGAVATATMLTGIILAGLGVCRLGFLTRFMSNSFIGGFTTAAAIHITSNQVPKMFGIAVSPQFGPGRVLKLYMQLFTKIESLIILELVIASVTFIILLIVTVFINEKYKDNMKAPVPIELIVVIAGTIISHFGQFEDKFNIKIIGDIPSGFPTPSIPHIENASRIIIDCVIMAILSLAITMSLAKLTAKRNETTLDDNQELIAYGICNIGSSFFSCFPQAASPPRTMILCNLGAKTTLNAIPTVGITLLIILWIGTFFQSLPVAILAAMIIVAMKDLLLQFRDIPRLWRINKSDCIIWVITCAVSVLVDLEYGVMAGIGFSILSIIVQNQMALGRIIGYSDKEDIFIDSKERANVCEIATIKIFQFQAPLNFANAEIFRNLLYKQVANPIKIQKENVKEEQNLKKIRAIQNDSETAISCNPKHSLKHIILDFQMISHVDLSGISTLCQIIKEYRHIGINVYLVKSSSQITKILTAAKFFDSFPKENMLYELADAIYYINMANMKTSDNMSVGKNIKL